MKAALALSPINSFDFWCAFFGGGAHLRHMEVPRLELNQVYSCQSTPQPQQHRI